MSFSITNTNKSTRKGSTFTKTALSKLVGSASIVVPSNLGLGAYPTAISFPNTSGNYALVETPNASPIGNSLFIEAWVYFGSIDSTAQTIFSMGDANNEYISIKVADQGGPEIAGPFTCSLQTTSGTTTVSSTINKPFSLNNLYYEFNLEGYDFFQYTEYNSEEEGKYDWHFDMSLDPNRENGFNGHRKLTIVMMLSDPENDFTGGDLQFNLGNEKIPLTVEMKKGRIIAFPSGFIHRVTPVTSGLRKTIVIWVEGPKFK